MQFKMLEPVTIRSWGVLVCKADNDLGGTAMGSLNNFISATISTFQGLGMTISPKPVVVFADDMGRYPDPGRFSQAVRSRSLDILTLAASRRRCAFR